MTRKEKYVIEINESIRLLREKQEISQIEACEGIMSRTSYSRFEKGERAISTDEYTKIMNRLRAHATDLNDIENLETVELNWVRTRHLAAFNNKLPKEELESLYFLLEKRVNAAPQVYRAYLYTKLHFHTKSELIPEITEEEIEDLFQQLVHYKHWTNFYVKIIMDFTVLFTPDQLIYLLKRLEKYRIEWISPIDCQYLHILPGALSNIADSLIDHAVLDQEKINTSLFPYALRACKKLKQVIELRPSFDYSLLLKSHHIRLEYFSAESKKSKDAGLVKAEKFLQEIIFINRLKDYDGDEIETTAEIVESSLRNLIQLGRPGTEIKYFTI